MAKVWAVLVMLLAGASIGGFADFTADGQVTNGPALVVSSAGQRAPAAEVRGRPPILIAAGDIAHCVSRGDEATAALIRDMPGTVATLGDHAYETGSKED